MYGKKSLRLCSSFDEQDNSYVTFSRKKALDYDMWKDVTVQDSDGMLFTKLFYYMFDCFEKISE